MCDNLPNTTLGCACEVAKRRYGGFMGPFAMLGMDLKSRRLP